MKLNPTNLHKILSKHCGDLKWWPFDKNYHKKNDSDPRFEIIVGAILTQNTAWSNVEKALRNLKSENMLEIVKIAKTETQILAKLIRSSGFFNQKAARLKDISSYFKDNYNSNLDCFFIRNIGNIREELLLLDGIGPETADSIILYAGEKPIFVVDAYTKRICKRIPFEAGNSYDEIQNFFQKELSKKYYNTKELVKIYNELHAQIVIFAKEYCRKKPLCKNCPLFGYCSFKEKLL